MLLLLCASLQAPRLCVQAPYMLSFMPLRPKHQIEMLLNLIASIHKQCLRACSICCKHCWCPALHLMTPTSDTMDVVDINVSQLCLTARQ